MNMNLNLDINQIKGKGNREIEMAVNFRDLFISTIQCIDDPGLDEMARFVVSDPLPCWGAIYEKFTRANIGRLALKNLIDRWIAVPDCARFLLLLIKFKQKDPEIMDIIAAKFAELPDFVQMYMASLSEAGIREVLEDHRNPAIEQLLSTLANKTAINREQQIIEAKINKLLRFQWAPTLKHNY